MKSALDRIFLLFVDVFLIKKCWKVL